MATNIDIWLHESETEKPNITMISYALFVTYFLVATQDIIVDGWALTMLKKFVFRYVSYNNIISVQF